MSTTVTPEVAAPAAATPAAPAAPAPVAPAAAPEPKTVSQVMDSIVSRPPATSEGSPEAPAAAPAAPAGAATPPAKVEGEGTPKADEKPAEPTKEVPPEVPLEFEAADGSRFKVKGSDGKYTGIPDNLGHIEFTVPGKNGEPDKTIVKPIGELVSLGRRAVALDRTVAQTKAELESVQGEAQEVAALNQSFVELMREVFSDETGEKWQARRDEFLQLTGPEARAKRAESELRTVRQQSAAQAEQAAAVGFYEARIAPQVAQAMQAAPDVAPETHIGKLNLLMAPLMVNGIVPRERHAELAELVEKQFVPWAKAEQARIAGVRPAAPAAVPPAPTADQRAAQEKVNQAARGVVPVGQPAPDLPVRPKPKNKEEAVAFIARRPVP